MSENGATAAWSKFVRESVGDLSNKVVAQRLGVSDSTVGNWVRGDHFTQPDGRSVIRFARIFHRPLAAALVAAGYGEEREYTETVLSMPAPADMSDGEIIEAIDDLVTEMRRRRG